MGSDLSVNPTKKAAGSEALLKAVFCWVRNQSISQESQVVYEKQWKSDYPQHIQTVAVCRDVRVWSPSISVQGLPR